jgi:hypothetical protein
MSRLQLVVVASLLLISGVEVYRVVAAPPAPESSDKESLVVRCARAQLQLAEATLEKAKQTNKRTPRLLPTDMISQLTDDVEIAKAQLASAQQTTEVDSLTGWLRRAQSALRGAEVNLKNANNVNQQAPGTFHPLDIDRLRLRVEIAKMQLERGKSLANASPDAKLQWQVDMLNDEVARLREQTAKIVQDRIPSSY